MKILKICKKYLQIYIRTLCIYIILSIFSNALAYLSPIITGNFIDGLINTLTINFVYKYCLILVVITFFSMILNFMLSMIYTKIQANMGYLFNRDVLFHVQNLPLSYTKTKDMSYTNQMINEDTNTLIIFCLNFFREFLLKLISIPILLFICYYINKEIALIFLFFLITYVILYHILKKYIFRNNYELRESQNRFFGVMFEQLSFIKFIKMNSCEDVFRNRLDYNYKQLYKTTIKNQKFVYLFSSLDGFISLCAQIVMYIFGALQILHGNFTIGNFTIYISYFNIILSIIRYLFNYGQSYQTTLVSHNRINEILNERVEPQGTIYIKHINSIRINELQYSYNEDQKSLFNNLIYTLEIGYIYGIIGQNGAGKTTLVNLILGLFNSELASDKLYYNDIDIKQLDMRTVRRELIAITEQEPVLINGSIRDNLLWHVNRNEDLKSDTTERDLKYLLNIFNLSELNIDMHIDALANASGLISGGEKQKISLIRTLLKKSNVIILDEPTSAVDVNSIEELMIYLNKIKSSKIIIIVTHDQYVSKMCDKTLLLSNSTFQS